MSFDCDSLSEEYRRMGRRVLEKFKRFEKALESSGSAGAWTLSPFAFAWRAYPN